MNTKTAIGVIVLVLVIVGGWYMLANKLGTTGETVKVGVILPLTGDSAKYGEPAQKVMQIALEEINAGGGVDGKPLELIIEDGECTGAGAASVMQKLISVDKVQVVLGGFCSGESLSVEPIGTKAKVAMLSPGSTSPKLTNVSPYFARNYPSASTQGEILAQIAYADKGWRTVAFIQEQTDYALGVYTAFTETFEKLGGTVTKEEFPTETTDFRSIVVKTKDGSPDALFVDTQAAPAADRILKQVAELGWKPNILVSNIVIADANIVKTQPVLEGALGAEFVPDPKNPKFAHLIEAYKTKYGEELPYQSYAQAEYDAVFLVRDAVKAVGYDGTKIASWFRTSVKNWDGAAGKVTIGPDGDPTIGFSPEVITNGGKKPYVK